MSYSPALHDRAIALGRRKAERLAEYCLLTGESETHVEELLELVGLHLEYREAVRDATRGFTDEQQRMWGR